MNHATCHEVEHYNFPKADGAGEVYEGGRAEKLYGAGRTENFTEADGAGKRYRGKWTKLYGGGRAGESSGLQATEMGVVRDGL